MNEQIRLIKDAQAGDKLADEKLIMDNSGLIWSIVKRYIGRGVEQDDLYQLACLGFIKAIRGFDGQYGTQFSTYAVPKIAGEIRRFLRDDGSIKISRSLKEQAVKLKQLQNKLETEKGRDITISELAKAANMPVEEVAMCEQATQATDSLQREVGEDGCELGELIGDDGIEEKIANKITIKQIVEDLPEKERQIINFRYKRNMTQEQCSKIMGISQVQVSRLEKRAIERMRKKIIE